MKYTETGFRALDGNFAVFPLNTTFQKALRGTIDMRECNCVLTYGYIDHEVGVTLEVIAPGVKDEDIYTFDDADLKNRLMVRVGAVENDDFIILDNTEGQLTQRYREKIEPLDIYDVNENVETTRKDIRLDPLRHEHMVDDVKVIVVNDRLKPEECWVRIEDIGDGVLEGTLLNEPMANFGYHRGDRVEFILYEPEEEQWYLVADLDREETGNPVENCILRYNNFPDGDTIISLLNTLCESYLWVPCNAVLSEGDIEQMKEIAVIDDEAEGEILQLKEDVRLIPDILKSDDGLFFPAFSTDEQMGDYGESFSKVEKHMLEIIGLAEGNEQDLQGIVINAFSESFVVDRDMFDIVRQLYDAKMKSEVEEE